MANLFWLCLNWHCPSIPPTPNAYLATLSAWNQSSSLFLPGVIFPSACLSHSQLLLMPYSPAGSAGSPTLRILLCFLPDELWVSCLLLISISFLTLCFMRFVQLFLHGITILFSPRRCAPEMCVSCEWLRAFCRKGSSRDIYRTDLWEKSIKDSVNTFLAFWYFLASANFWFTFCLFYFFYSLQKLISISPASFPCSTVLMLYQSVNRWLPFLCLEIQFIFSRRGLGFFSLSS